MSGEFEKATLSFEFDSALLENENFVPRIYYFNEETQLLEELPNQIVNGNVVSVETTHFSKYILLNTTDYYKVWDEDIRKPSEVNNSMDVVFVTDISMSMDWNDPDWIRKTVINDFIDHLTVNDRSALVGFRRCAEVKQTLTNNHSSTKSAVNTLYNDNGKNSLSGTNGSDGLYQAVSMFETDYNSERIIIFLTDGEDTHSSYNYSDVITYANSKNVCIYTVGLGDGINEAQLRSVASQTSGKFYKADIADDLIHDYTTIFVESVDYFTDSNNDGISDYYTKLMCAGKLVSGTGIPLFEGISYESVQTNDDYDGDGIKNGDEVEVIYHPNQNKVYLIVHSSPVVFDGDKDGIDDSNDEDPLTYKYYGLQSRGEFGTIEFQGEMYNIVVPDHVTTYITSTDTWETINERIYHDYEFDMLKFFMGLSFGSSVKTPRVYAGRYIVQDETTTVEVGLCGVLCGLLTTIDNSIEKYEVNFKFQKNSSGDRRVIIKTASDSSKEFFQKYAGHYYSAYESLGGKTYARYANSLLIREILKDITEVEYSNGIYDFREYIDNGHRGNNYSSYLWFDGEGKVMESPIIYRNDRVTLGKIEWGKFHSITDLYLGGALPIDMVYQEAFDKYFFDTNIK